MSYLSFNYSYDGTPTHILDDFGWLEVRVETERRAGSGGFWVQWQDIKLFADTLSTCPISPFDPLVMQYGYDTQEGDDLILRVEIAQANSRGELAVRVEIADLNDPKDRFRAKFVTLYSELALWRVDLLQLMDGDRNEARLSGQ